jgi:hypothetical protein
MSISTSDSSISYVGNNSTSTPYVVNYPFFDASDLKVYSVTSGTSTLLALTTNYTVTGGNGSTGSIVTTAAIPATSTVIITRDVPYTQLTSLTTGDRLPAASLEKALDKVTMQAQQLSRNTIPDTASTAGSSPYVLGLSTTGGSPSWVSQSAAAIADGSIVADKLNTGHPNWDASGNLTATSFVGPLTGAVTGNVTGNVVGNVTGNLTGTASAIPDLIVSTAKVQDSAITTAKIASNSVTAAKLGTNEQQQIARAWGGASSTGLIDAEEFNLVSITRSGLGNYLVTTAQPIVGHKIVATPKTATGNQATAAAASTTQFRVYTYGGGGTSADAAFQFVVFGD